MVQIYDYRPDFYGIVLDGESQPRQFSEQELEPEAGAVAESSTRGELA
ncbi:MAG: hypothetical protein HY704_08365 [Gemmatimonadetes bacterium]|nr:hypothetical protein [Gemmatimonadota bacterium]